MQTDVRELSEVDYALDIVVPADEIQSQITDQLKKERGQISLKGFRPGKVPMGVVRKMVGQQVAVQVAEQAIGEAYRTAVVENEAYDPIGQPRLAEMEFDVNDTEAELKAEVRFGVSPQFDLAEMDGVPVTKLVRTFTEEDIEADLTRRREMAAVLVDEDEGTELTEAHVAIVDIQPVDAEGEATGPKQNDAQIILANPDLRPELKEALIGLASGAETVVEFPHDHGDDEESDHDDHVDRYRVTVQGVQRREIPEMTDEWVQEHTNGKVETVDGLREEARRELEESWNRRSRQNMESKMVEAFVDAHPFAVPEVLTDAALDAGLDEIRQKQESKQLPAGFDLDAYRDQNRQQAENQVRWLMVKDKLIEEEGLEVTNEDFEAEFERIAGEDGDVEMMKGFFTQQPQMMQQMGDHLLNQRVFESLSKRFEIVEKSREDLEAEAEK
ncbi:MAG: trigger factor [Bacteroidota bacterium]